MLVNSKKKKKMENQVTSAMCDVCLFPKPLPAAVSVNSVWLHWPI